jgi:3-oxoacyl-[acyl-carrier protein] reductase
MDDWNSKVAVVSGAGHGFGKEICKQFALRGAHVIGTDIQTEKLTQTQSEINKIITESCSSGSIHTIQSDLTNEHHVQTLIHKVLEEHGAIHILVNNAGGVVGQVHQSIEEVSGEQWDRVININLKAVFYMIRAVAPTMKAQQYGRIINISSGAGRSASLTGIQAYTSAKAGQIGLTRQMAKELGPYGITVNNVAPGFVLSNPSTEKQWEAMGEERQQHLLNSISLKRLGKPEEIAHAVLYFASDYSSYVSGQVISVDGGLQLF